MTTTDPRTGEPMTDTQAEQAAAAAKVADARAALDAAEAEAAAAGEAPVEVTLESLDARVTELERRHNGGAAE